MCARYLSIRISLGTWPHILKSWILLSYRIGLIYWSHYVWDDPSPYNILYPSWLLDLYQTGPLFFPDVVAWLELLMIDQLGHAQAHWVVGASKMGRRPSSNNGKVTKMDGAWGQSTIKWWVRWWYFPMSHVCSLAWNDGDGSEQLVPQRWWDSIYQLIMVNSLMIRKWRFACLIILVNYHFIIWVFNLCPFWPHHARSALQLHS